MSEATMDTRTNINGPAHPATPRNGRALYAWLKEAETLYEVALSAPMAGWMRSAGLPSRFIDLDSDGVGICYREAQRRIREAQARVHPCDGVD